MAYRRSRGRSVARRAAPARGRSVAKRPVRRRTVTRRASRGQSAQTVKLVVQLAPDATAVAGGDPFKVAAAPATKARIV